jgi:hypothetical protein
MLQERTPGTAFACRPAPPARQRVAPGHGWLTPAVGGAAHGRHVPRGGAIAAGVCQDVFEVPTDARGFTREGAGSCACRC